MIKGRALGDKQEHSRCVDRESPQPCCFLTHCMTFWGTLLHFSATGGYDTNFLTCGMASSDRRPCERAALWHSSWMSSPPPLSSSDSNLRPCITSWPQSPLSKAIHKANIRRCFLGQGLSLGGFQKGLSASLRAAVTSIRLPQPSAVPSVSRHLLPRQHFILAAVLRSIKANHRIM